MGFELKQDESVRKGVRRVVRNRIDKALQSLDSGRQWIDDEAVHDARKRFKEIRSTLRLVRDDLGDKEYRRENRTFRDAGRPLSALRDATVLINVLADLAAYGDGRVHRPSLAHLRRELVHRQHEIRMQVLEHDHAVPDIARRIRKAKREVDGWHTHRGWKAIEPGLREAYRDGRSARQHIRAGASDEALHEWRKRVQNLRYDLELLEPTFPEAHRGLADRFHRLSDLLGDDHDLAVLRGIACETAQADGHAGTISVTALIDERRAALQKEARALGAQLYHEAPTAFTRRLSRYWKAAHQDQNSNGSPAAKTH